MPAAPSTLNHHCPLTYNSNKNRFLRRASLLQCEGDEDLLKLVPCIKGADPMAAALLIECRGRDAAALEASMAEVQKALTR